MYPLSYTFFFETRLHHITCANNDTIFLRWLKTNSPFDRNVYSWLQACETRFVIANRRIIVIFIRSNFPRSLARSHDGHPWRSRSAFDHSRPMRVRCTYIHTYVRTSNPRAHAELRSSNSQVPALVGGCACVQDRASRSSERKKRNADDRSSWMHTRVRDTDTAPRSLEQRGVCTQTRGHGFLYVYIQLPAVRSTRS